MKINSKTSLTEIKSKVFIDFHVEIDNGKARKIREAARKGCLLWSPSGSGLITTDSSQINIQRTK